ncbi:hypothetical protein AB3N58_10225 [Leptospira sp. WS60.C2]
MKEDIKNNGSIFVLMPFSNEFNDLYKLGIKEPLQKLGFLCERVDEQHFEDLIIERIQNQIRTADYVLGVTDTLNPNVFYEIGFSHALQKKTILIAKSEKTIPFDLKQYPHIIYNSIGDLKEKLISKFEHYLKNPTIFLDPLDNIEIYISGLSINQSNTRINFNVERNFTETNGFQFEDQSVDIHFEIENNSNLEFQQNLQFGLEIPKSIGLIPSKKEKTFLTKNRMLMFMSEKIETIYPKSISKIIFTYYLEENLNENQNLEFEGILHLYSIIGKKEFPIKLKISC